MSLLADLKLEALPIEALLALTHGIAQEVERRRSQQDLLSIDITPTSPAKKPLRPFPSHVRKLSLDKRITYLPQLLAQDWTPYFQQRSDPTPQYYVYAHIDPRQGSLALPMFGCVLQGSPFYIGKGVGNRAWDLKRNQGHGKFIQHIRRAGYGEATLVHILMKDLSEQQALILEAKLIYFFGSIYDDTTQGCLVNLADPFQSPFLADLSELPSQKEYKELLTSIAEPLPKKEGPLKIPTHIREMWKQWQANPLITNQLAPGHRDAGYTIVRIAPQSRATFFRCLPLLQAIGSLSTMERPPQPALDAIDNCHTFLHRLTAYLHRVLAGKPATPPY